MSSNMIVKARILRKQMTESEKKLWQRLRGRRLGGYRYRKQAPLGDYILDFVCHEAKVIIELDGGQHNREDNISYDQKRTKWLSDQGYLVQRFWNNEVMEQLEAVLGVILEICDKRHPPILSFPHKKRGEGTI